MSENFYVIFTNETTIKYKRRDTIKKKGERCGGKLFVGPATTRVWSVHNYKVPNFENMFDGRM